MQLVPPISGISVSYALPEAALLEAGAFRVETTLGAVSALLEAKFKERPLVAVPADEIDVGLVEEPWVVTEEGAARVATFWRAAVSARPMLHDGEVTALAGYECVGLRLSVRVQCAPYRYGFAQRGGVDPDVTGPGGSGPQGDRGRGIRHLVHPGGERSGEEQSSSAAARGM